MKNNGIINGNCWVAYFDILGTQQEVQFHEECGRPGILEAYNKALEEIERSADYRKGHVNAVWFSDTFIFYSVTDPQKCLPVIEYMARAFFRRMLFNSVSLRGCLNFGQFYADENRAIHFGTALNEAYELAERQDWIGYVLSEKAKQTMERHFTQEGKTYWDVFKSHYFEYDVPMKRDKQKRLPAYDMSIHDNRSSQDAENEQRELLRKLISNYNVAKTKIEENIRNRPGICNRQRIEILKSLEIKHANTKDFLSKIYPRLRNEVSKPDLPIT